MAEFFSWRDAPAADFAVIGDPVSHSLSPRMHTAAYAALGLNLRYVAIHVPACEVVPALDHLRSLGYRGVNVTVPHKESALDWCSEAESLARRVRAVNTVRLADRSGINTDAPGFLDTLADLLLGPSPELVLLLGAGGSARALTCALAEAGWQVRIYNRTRSRAEEMVANLGVDAEVLDAADPTGARLILNTTSASLQGAEVAIPWQCAEPDAVAYDLMYAKEPTPFLAAASAHGLRTCDGLPLLVAQGARSLEWWLDVSAPRDAMRAALA